MNVAKTNGQHGESLALQYLQNIGYKILATNWRFKHWEVDIIAQDGASIVFVEVKTRSSTAFGTPDEFVDEKKQRNLAKLAEAYLKIKGHDGDIRFDIVSILKTNHSKLRHIKDAFWQY